MLLNILDWTFFGRKKCEEDKVAVQRKRKKDLHLAPCVAFIPAQEKCAFVLCEVK